jgi:hypothetical protein
MRRTWTFAPLALIALATIGCGYSIRPPFDPAIRTVYVPVFRSAAYRRDLNLQLTELVQKEIERRSGYKVVGSPEGADTTLEGQVVYGDKNIRVENPNNLPRELLTLVTVQVRWLDNRNPDPKEQAKPYSIVVESLPFYPEIGDTTQAAFQRTLEKIARDIVNMMEQTW